MPDFANPDFELDTAGREEESLFARDENDVLIRREKETRDRFGQFVEIVIDGYVVKVPRAVGLTVNAYVLVEVSARLLTVVHALLPA